jgi:hypothetical protein
MKKLAASVLLSVAASIGVAQEDSRLVLPIDLECSSQSGTIAEYVKQEYQEQNFAQGRVALQSSKTGEWQIVKFELYVNPKTQSWTMLAKMENGVDCAIASGSNFVPWLSKTP